MANIKPFRGIRYNQDKIDHINNVISQPYDRIRYGLQEQYYDLSDYNITRIIKGKEYDYRYRYKRMSTPGPVTTSTVAGKMVS